jgi:hypothetical protein
VERGGVLALNLRTQHTTVFYLKLLNMAHTHWNELTPVSSAASLDGRLEYCTPTEESEPVSFYTEDILRVTNQAGCEYISKKMATFWGLRLQVWVGHDAHQNVIKGVIALRCPPYYPPHTTVGVEATAAGKPSGFPTVWP